jgi:hypothetical protein
MELSPAYLTLLKALQDTYECDEQDAVEFAIIIGYLETLGGQEDDV